MLTIKPHSSLVLDNSGLTIQNDTREIVRFGRITINGKVVHDTPPPNPAECEAKQSRVKALDFDLVQPAESPIQTIQICYPPTKELVHG